MKPYCELEKELLELKQHLLELKQFMIEWKINNRHEPNHDELDLIYDTAQSHIHAKQSRVSALQKICDM